jgi:hypothetical protein
MSVSIFNPEQFLDATTTESLVRRPPIPAGTELLGVITDIKPRVWQGKKDPSQSGVVMDVQIELDTSGVKDQPPKVTLTDGIMLDVTAQGSIDYSPGHNAKLRRYREALGMNVAGQPFSFRMMLGRPIRVSISHRVVEGETYDQINGVAKV